jgi:Skp family chaperone for outer membrane proteins
MKTPERILLWSGLIGLAAINGVWLLSSSGRAAFAETTAFFADVLGPAEAIKLTDGDKELTLHAKDHRLAWGDDDYKQSYTVAFMDITRVLNPLIEAEALVEERTALQEELSTTEADYRSRIEALREELQGMDRESPEAQAKFIDFRELVQEATEWGQEAMKRKNTLDVQHWEKCYRELASAVNIVAEKNGIDIVLRFIPTDQDFKAQDAEQALTEIRLRTAVRYPEKLDITDQVVDVLGIQETND